MAGVRLEQLLSRFRFAGLEHRAGPAADGEVAGLASADEHGQVPDASGLLVLGIGLEDGAAVARAWRTWSHRGALALIVRTGSAGAAAGEPLPDTSTSLLGIGDDISWMQLAAMITGDLDRAQRPSALADLDSADVLGDGADDFYAIANALSALVDGPVTIEDMDSRILAFSEDQDRADEHRKRSILERRVSREHNRVLEDEGVFTRLYASPEPIFFQPPIDGAFPRAAMRIRYGAETLGSVWAVVQDQLSSIQAQGLVEASNVLALSIMRRRLLDETRRERHSSQVTQLLTGGVGAATAAAELRIADVPTFVLAFDRRLQQAERVDAEYRAHALARALTPFVTSIHPRAVLAALGGTVYAVVPHPAAAGQSAHAAEARRFAQDLLHRVTHEDVVIGIGDVVPEADQLSRSRRQADSAARALRHGTDPAVVVGYWRDTQVEALLLEMVDLMVARHESLGSPFDRLQEDKHDQLATLAAYLDHFGDVSAAAADLFMHPNTIRYRLRMLGERDGIDLADPETRFALMLQIRLHRARTRLAGHVAD